MGIVTALLGYAIYTAAIAALPKTPAVRIGTAFAAAWVSVMAAATLTSFQLALSGTSDLDVALPAMLGVHALIGIGEGLITAAAVAFVSSAQPDLLESTAGSRTAVEAR
jgi:cobalt/nickel transport system permease protein